MMESCNITKVLSKAIVICIQHIPEFLMPPKITWPLTSALHEKQIGKN